MMRLIDLTKAPARLGGRLREGIPFAILIFNVA
jgi:hypothetical protein